jgi:hypothetical protein
MNPSPLPVATRSKRVNRLIGSAIWEAKNLSAAAAAADVGDLDLRT